MQFLYNGNENIIDYAIAVPTDRMQTLNITGSSSPDSVKGIAMGGIVRKKALKMLSDQLMSQELGRYNYSGYSDSWCGNVSAQTLYTQDIIRLMGSPGRTAYSKSDIYNINDTSNDYNSFHFGGTSSSKFAEYASTIADKKICSIEVNRNEYLVYHLSDQLTATVLTPDGLKSMNVMLLDNPTIYVYDMRTSYYE